MVTPNVGDIVYSIIGHRYRVLEVYTPYRFRLQAVTSNGVSLVDIGTPFMAGRSDLRLD